MLVHFWNSALEGTLCGREIGRAGMTVERQYANCEACVSIFESSANEKNLASDEAIAALRKRLTSPDEDILENRIANLKEQARILQGRLDRLQGSREQLELVMRLIKEL